MTRSRTWHWPIRGNRAGIPVCRRGSRSVRSASGSLAYLIEALVPAIVGIVLFVVLPDASTTVRGVLSIVAALVVVGWALLIWYMLAERAAGPGMRAMRIQLVGFYDGRPIGWVRVLLRALIFWALGATGIGLVLLLVFLVLHPRKQGWHDLAVKAVVIKERMLAPAAPRAGVAQHVTIPPEQPHGAAVHPAPDVRAGARPTRRCPVVRPVPPQPVGTRRCPGRRARRSR